MRPYVPKWLTQGRLINGSIGSLVASLVLSKYMPEDTFWLTVPFMIIGLTAVVLVVMFNFPPDTPEIIAKRVARLREEAATLGYDLIRREKQE